MMAQRRWHTLPENDLSFGVYVLPNRVEGTDSHDVPQGWQQATYGAERSPRGVVLVVVAHRVDW